MMFLWNSSDSDSSILSNRLTMFFLKVSICVRLGLTFRYALLIDLRMFNMLTFISSCKLGA